MTLRYGGGSIPPRPTTFLYGDSKMEKNPMTAGGFTRLQDELKQLKTIERPAVIKAIAEAREHGDLKENAEYHAARERQSFIEGRVAIIEDRMSRAQVIDTTTLKDKDTVQFGSLITVIDNDTDEELDFQIVGQDESDVKQGLLSFTAPLARGLIGKKVGSNVEIITPKGSKSYEIAKISVP